MKILAVSDPHGSAAAMKKIKVKSKYVDLILLAGDFTIFQQDMEKILKEYDKMGKRILLIPGNHEDPEDVEQAVDKYKNLVYIDERIYEEEGLIVFGMEGNGFSLRDKPFEQVSKKYMPLIKKNRKGRTFILMTHAPPFETKCDIIMEEEHCGNESIRKFIEKMQPEIAICGHIHDTFGTEDLIGKTHVMNPGPEGRIINI